MVGLLQRYKVYKAAEYEPHSQIDFMFPVILSANQKKSNEAPKKQW